MSSGGSVQKTFDDLDPTAPLGGTDYCGPNNPKFNPITSTVTVPSRVKAGRMVTVNYTKSQTNRVPLDKVQLDIVDKIEDEIPSYKLAMMQSQEALFGKHFKITLRKKDVWRVKSGPRTKKKKGQASEASIRRSKFRKDSVSEEPLSSEEESSEEVESVSTKSKGKSKKPPKGKEEEEEESLPTVYDQPEVVLLPEIALQVQEKYWQGACKEIMARTSKQGICPLYFVPVEPSIAAYYKTTDEVYQEEEESEEIEESEESINEDEGSGEGSYYEGYEEKPLKKGKIIETEGPSTKMYDAYEPKETEELADSSFEDELRKGGEFHRATPRDQQTTGRGKMSSHSLTQWTSSKRVPVRKGKTPLSDLEAEKIYGSQNPGNGPADALEAFGISFERDPKNKNAPLKVPITGEIVNEELGAVSDANSLFSAMANDPRSKHYGMVGAAGAPSIAHEVQAPNTMNGNEPTEGVDVNEIVPPPEKKKGKRGKKYESKGKRKREKRPSKKNKRLKSERGGPNLREVEITETHYIPVIPDSKLGIIEVYEDITHNVRFMWTWKNTNDEYEGKVEPYMLFVLRAPPTIEGKLKSPLSNGISEYKTCKDGERQRAEMLRETKNPVYIVARPEPRSSHAANGGLTDENYVSMATGAPVGGGGSLSVNANTGSLYPANTRWQDPNHPDGLVPSGYRTEDGPGAIRSWNSGTLMDAGSREHTNTFRAVNLANTLNGMYGDPSSLYMSVQQERAQAAHRINSSRNKLQSLDPEYAKSEMVAQAEADIAQAFLNRQTVKAPIGTFIFLEPGESITELKRPENPLESMVEASKERLESMASLWGGYPLNSLYNPKSLKSPDGAFSTKVTSTSSNACNYGLGVAHTMQSPTKDFVNDYQSQARNFFKEVIKTLFTFAYADIFRSKEAYWKKLLENTFIDNPAADLSRRNAKNNSSAGANSLPSFQSFFEIQVSFPFADTMGLENAINLSNMGLYEDEDLIPFMASMDNGSIIPQHVLSIVQDKKKDDSYEAIVARVKEKMSELRQFEKDKIKKPELGGAGAKPKAKKKSTNKGKK